MPCGPASAVGVKDGDVDGDMSENLGIRAAEVAEAPVPATCVGADRDGAGPKSSASKGRSRPSGGATSGAAQTVNVSVRA